MQREAMVREQIEARGVKDPRVLDALRRVPRERFVLSGSESLAYQDYPLPIGHGQTISQPYIVAVMSEAAAIGPDDVVLEIGTGSAYQAAVLGRTRAHGLHDRDHPCTGRASGGAAAHARLRQRTHAARRRLRRLARARAVRRDRRDGGTAVVPEALKQQLKVGGRMVVPVGTDDQELLVIERTADGFTERRLMPVRFVPMVQGRE